jgi:DNA-binding Lrp family transcriptional regulator
MRQTSIFAYHELTDKQLSKRKIQVLDGLRKLGTGTNRMISEASGVPINVVTPRMGEMVVEGVIEEDHRDVDPGTGRKAIFWRVAKT